MDSELTFISSLLSASEAEQHKYASAPVPLDFFVKRKQEIQWVYEIRARTGQFPQLDTFGNKFNVKVVPVTELPEIALEPVVDSALYHRMEEITAKASQLLSRGTPALEVARYFKEQAESMNTLRPNFDEVNWGEDDQVFDRYKLRKKLMTSGQMNFLDTPWTTINQMLGFLRPGETVQIVGRPSMGKSYIALWWARYAAKQGHRTLFITKEMPKDQVEERLEVMEFKLHPTRFRHCTLTRSEMFKWKVNRKKFNNPNLIINGRETIEGTGLDDVHAAIERHKPSVVFVDGLYLMTDKSIKDRTQRYEEISRSFKRLAKVTNVVAVGVLQHNREAEGSIKEQKKIVRATMATIYGSDAWGQDSDVVMSVDGARGLKSFREINFLKAREAEIGTPIPIKYQFDPYIDLSEASAQYIEQEERKRSKTVTIDLDFLVKQIGK